MSMRLLISALAAAGIIGFSMASYAADEPYTAQPKVTKPGRAIDEGTVQSGNNLNKPGRQIDDGTVKADKPKKFGRAIDDGTVKAPNKEKAAGRAIDDGTVKADKPKKYGRAIDDQGKKNVKSKGASDAPGRAVTEEPKK